MKRDDRRPVRTVEKTTLPRELLLCVEDDDDNWEVAELRLGSNYELIRAANDEEACRLVRQYRGKIDVVLMDIELRGSALNGVELTELLRGSSRKERSALPAYAQDLPIVSKPIIYVTAHGARFSDAQLLLSGADKVISKPVNFTALQEALSEFMLDRTKA